MVRLHLPVFVSIFRVSYASFAIAIRKRLLSSYIHAHSIVAALCVRPLVRIRMPGIAEVGRMDIG